MRMTDIKNKIHELIESAYKMGYEDGKNLKYDLGLNDAWECAKKIYSLSAGEIINIFGGCSTWVNYSASEAIALINKYEKGREKKCSDCKHYVTDGNTTFCSLSKAGGCCVNKDNWTPKKMTLDEAIKHCEEVAEEQEKYCPVPKGVVDKHKKCAEEHRQLAEWLRELKRLKGEE